MIVNLRHVDTSPGADGNNPFTPPAQFAGNADDYVRLIRERYQQLDHGQHIVCMVRRLLQQNRYALEYSGPFADQACSIINHLLAVYRAQGDEAA
jgi:hypothetical protein